MSGENHVTVRGEFSVTKCCYFNNAIDTKNSKNTNFLSTILGFTYILLQQNQY